MSKTTYTLTGQISTTDYDDSELKTRIKALEDKPDNDKQTLSLDGRTLSISNGNSVTLPASGGSIASAISAYSGSYTNSAYDDLLKGNSIKAEDNVTELVPDTSNGNLQVIESTQGIFLRTRSVNDDAIVAPLTHENKDPKFIPGNILPENTDITAELNAGIDAGIGYITYTTGNNNYSSLTLQMGYSEYFDNVSILLDPNTAKASLIVYKGSHVYTMVNDLNVEEETNSLRIIFNFPAYADFGLDSKFEIINLLLRC